MSVTKLAEWLNGKRDYDAGCLLYHDFGHQVHSQSYYTALKNSLAQTRQPGKLEKAVVEVYKHFLKEPEQQSETLSEHGVQRMTTVAVRTKVTHDAKKDQLLSELDDKMRTLYADIGSRWKPKLHSAKTDGERFEIQKVIDRLETELQAVLSQIEHVEEHGKMPARKKEKTVMTVAPNTAKAAMEYMNVQKYVSLYNRKIEAAKKELMTCEDKKRIAKLNRDMDKWELRRQNYKKELSELETLVHGKS